MSLNYNEPASGPDVATESIASQHYQLIKMIDGTAGSTTVICAGGGVEAGALRVTIASDSTGVVSVDDNGSSLTVDAPVGTPVFVRLSDGSSAIATLPVSLASVPSHAVTNAGTFAVQAAQSGTWTVDLGATDNAVLDSIVSLLTTIDVDTGNCFTSLATLDDTVYADNGGWTDDVSRNLLVGGVYQSSPHTVTDGRVSPFLVDANGRMVVAVNGTLTVGSHAVTNAGTFAVQAAQSGTWTVDLGATDNAVLDAIAASVAAIDTDTTTIIGHVDGIETLLGTIDTDTGNIATSLAVMDDWDNAASDGASVSGDVAHDDADAGEPVKLGAKAIAHGTNPTAVAANDRTNLYANRHGIPWVIGGHPNVICHSVRVLDSDGAQSDVAMVTVSTGTKIVVTRVSITADGSNTGPINVKVGFGTATLTTPNTTTAGSQILADFLGVPAGGGITIGDGSGILGIGADNEDLRYTTEDPAGGAITIMVSYFTIES